MQCFLHRFCCAILVSVLASVSLCAQAAQRDSISIIGSSTVFPFSKVVAERFGRMYGYRTPTIEQTGTGGGFREFCRGMGAGYVDVINASRPIKKSERALCAENGVTDIVEVMIGYGGIVLANSVTEEQLKLSRRDIFLALAKHVPNPDGSETVIPNPYRRWKDINPELPDIAIEVLGPPSTSGTRDALIEFAMEPGCKQFAWLEKLSQSDRKQFRRICRLIREDGVYLNAGENDNLIVHKLTIKRGAVGIFGFNFLDQNTNRVQAAIIEGQLPEFETIKSNEYVVSRPLFFYIKRAHIGVIAGLDKYLREFTSEKAWSDDGYLADKGLVPLALPERQSTRERLFTLLNAQ